MNSNGLGEVPPRVRILTGDVRAAPAMLGIPREIVFDVRDVRVSYSGKPAIANG